MFNTDAADAAIDALLMARVRASWLAFDEAVKRGDFA
jgi:hypothetical protein